VAPLIVHASLNNVAAPENSSPPRPPPKTTSSQTATAAKRQRTHTIPRPSTTITLITDFGAQDYFVGAMKGVILSGNPDAQVVDITHDIPAQDIKSAAFTLLACYRSFAPGTIHVAVVDPEVGSDRHAILIQAAGQYFIGPDNGIFSYICDREKDYRVTRITSERYFRQPVSSTFHGRDVFAPVAAALSSGTEPSAFGKYTDEFVRLDSLVPQPSKKGKIKGRIINIDRFGNCVTSFTEDQLSADMIDAGAKLSVNGKAIKNFRKFFAEEKEKSKKLFAYWGSAGFLEIAARNNSAAKMLKAKRGDAVVLLQETNR
jgi:S-adenosyl-L-methionine hydrolase (adenosine-forming)